MTRIICSAPGKVILFGEHAVVYGHPALATVTDQRTYVQVDSGAQRNTVNGHRMHDHHHRYLMTAVERCWMGGPVDIQTDGGVPSASGTGSSAALTVAAVSALAAHEGIYDYATIAQRSFFVERSAQGGGSPTDTSVSTAGGAIAIAGHGETLGLGPKLWSPTFHEPDQEDLRWNVERVSIAPMTVVIGNSGVRGRTSEEVAKVARAMQRNAMVRDTLQQLGDISRDAVPYLRSGDLVEVGHLMDQAHRALHTIGVNHPAVQGLVDAVRDLPGTFGAKMTGAGGGGSILCLTEQPERAMNAIREAGGIPFAVEVGGQGARLEDPELTVVEGSHAPKLR